MKRGYIIMVLLIQLKGITTNYIGKLNDRLDRRLLSRNEVYV